MYCVINMDIVGSRKVQDRKQLQDNLNSYIARINHKYSGILVAPITITLGDEWQVITNKPSEAYHIVHEFQQLLWKDNIELYAGIGVGDISTPLNHDVRMMDGSCFHAAREAINIIKGSDKSKRKANINKLNKVFLLSAFVATSLHLDGMNDPIKPYPIEEAMGEAAVAKAADVEVMDFALISRSLLEQSINLIIENNEILKAKMTDKQREVYIDYIRLGSYRKIVGDSEDKTRETISGISQKLNNASFFTIQKNHQLVSILLDTYSGKGA